MAITKRLVETAPLPTSVIGIVAASAPDSAVGRGVAREQEFQSTRSLAVPATSDRRGRTWYGPAGA
jgi:hypothetical protein